MVSPLPFVDSTIYPWYTDMFHFITPVSVCVICVAVPAMPVWRPEVNVLPFHCGDQRQSPGSRDCTASMLTCWTISSILIIWSSCVFINCWGEKSTGKGESLLWCLSCEAKLCYIWNRKNDGGLWCTHHYVVHPSDRCSQEKITKVKS